MEPAPWTSLSVSGLEVPEGEANLVLKAARALEAAAGRPLPARMRLLKRIPPGAGLGGGSSDASAALRALSRLYTLDLDTAAVAAALGADVPFFLRGGRARAKGRGERLQPLADESWWFALAWPGIQVSTAAVYERWDACGGEPPNDLQRPAIDLHPELAAFAEALGQGWRLTGSGSAWFRPCASRAEAEHRLAAVPGWKAAVRSVPRWA